MTHTVLGFLIRWEEETRNDMTLVKGDERRLWRKQRVEYVGDAKFMPQNTMKNKWRTYTYIYTLHDSYVTIQNHSHPPVPHNLLPRQVHGR